MDCTDLCPEASSRAPSPHQECPRNTRQGDSTASRIGGFPTGGARAPIQLCPLVTLVAALRSPPAGRRLPTAAPDCDANGRRVALAALSNDIQAQPRRRVGAKTQLDFLSIWRGVPGQQILCSCSPLSQSTTVGASHIHVMIISAIRLHQFVKANENSDHDALSMFVSLVHPEHLG